MQLGTLSLCRYTGRVYYNILMAENTIVERNNDNDNNNIIIIDIGSCSLQYKNVYNTVYTFKTNGDVPSSVTLISSARDDRR